MLNRYLTDSPLLTTDRAGGGTIETVADPFPISHEGRLHVLVEVVGRRESGEYFKKIGVFCVEDDLNEVKYLGETWPEDDGQYSFPFVVRDGDRYLMLPEVFVPFAGGGPQALQLLQIYQTQVSDFPFGWRKLHEGMLEGCAAPSDKLLLRNGDEWQLFCSDNSSMTLRLYRSTDLARWSPHPENPVIGHRRLRGWINRVVPSGTVAANAWRIGGGPVGVGEGVALPLQHACGSVAYGGAVSLLGFDRLDGQGIECRVARRRILSRDPSRRWISQGAHHVALTRHAGRIVAATDGFDGMRWNSTVFEVPAEAGIGPCDARGGTS